MKQQNTKKMGQNVTVPIVPFLLNLIYPPICGICGKLNNNFLCNKCCKMLQNEAKNTVERNSNINNQFDEHMYIFKYEGIIRRLILEYKFQEKAYLYKTFVNFLIKNEKIFENIKSYDTIIPVPISKKRKKARGYNQSYLISKEIANITGIKINNKSLFKVNDIIEQSKLNKEERLKNIKNVYELRNYKDLDSKKVLLFDDIYTTGSTVNECCRILKKANPIKIGVFTIAKD